MEHACTAIVLSFTYAHEVTRRFVERASSPSDKADKDVRAKHEKPRSGGSSSERVMDH